MGSGNTIVEFFSADMVFSVWRVWWEKFNYHRMALFGPELLTWRYRSCSADGESPMISDASRNARAAFCSPSDAMIFARASRDASAWGQTGMKI